MDTSTHEELTSRECWQLLKSADVGRLAVCLQGEPDIFPVNYVVSNGTLVFRTGAGTKHVGVHQGRDLAFEIDGIDEEAGEAWSVVVKGVARDVTSDQELAHVEALPLRTMHAGYKGFYVRIEPSAVSGRRFPIG